jgi:hypothetical protein
MIPAHSYDTICQRNSTFDLIWPLANAVDSLAQRVFRHDGSVQLLILQSYMTTSISGIFIVPTTSYPAGTRWRSRLRRCATSRTVAVSIPDGVTRIFHRHNPCGRTTALVSTQSVTEMSSRSISWEVKAAGRKPYHLHVPTVLKSGSLNLLEP